MPFMLSHIMFACKRAPFELWGPTLFLGAQGPDPFFYLLTEEGRKVGRRLHELSASYYETAMESFPESYRIGFLSHLELDDLLHQYIREATSDYKKHTQLEITLDDIIWERSLGTPLRDMKPWKMIQTPELASIVPSFHKIMAENGIRPKDGYDAAVRRMTGNLKRLYHWMPFKKRIVSLLSWTRIDFRFMYPRREGFKDDQLVPYMQKFYELLSDGFDEHQTR